MTASKLVLLVSFVCFLLAFLSVVTASHILWSADGWGFAGLALLVASMLVE